MLHWFSGTAAEASRAASLGCYFSVNQAMFKSDRGVSLIKKLPLDRILTETDGPFVEIEGRPIAPGDVSEVLRLIASAVGGEVHDMQRTIVKNFATLVSSL